RAPSAPRRRSPHGCPDVPPAVRALRAPGSGLMAPEAHAHEPIQRLVQQAALRSPASPAIERGGGPLTHAELDGGVRRLAARLVAAGLAEGDLVAILATTSADVIASMLAVLWAGGAFVPLDLQSPATRLESVVAEVRPRFWLVAAELSEVVE